MPFFSRFSILVLYSILSFIQSPNFVHAQGDDSQNVMDRKEKDWIEIDDYARGKGSNPNCETPPCVGDGDLPPTKECKKAARDKDLAAIESCLNKACNPMNCGIYKLCKSGGANRCMNDGSSQSAGTDQLGLKNVAEDAADGVVNGAANHGPGKGHKKK